MNPTESRPEDDTLPDDDGPRVGLLDLLTWLGEGKRTLAMAAGAGALVSLAVAFALTPIYTARVTLLPPGAQQSSGSAAALAALGSLGGLAGGLAGKTPDELYVALLKSDSVTRALDERLGLRQRYELASFEALRRALPARVRISADRKSGVIAIEVDDKDPKFAADFANTYPVELTKVMGRLAVSEAAQRRQFYEQQLKDTKERLIAAEQDLRKVQEKSGVIVLDKQAEALIGGAAQLRALIAEREVQLKVLRTSATEQHPDVIRLQSELRALRGELARMESSKESSGSAVDLPVGQLPAAAIDYVRARRELKLQETLLEGIVRQYELAKLDEAKEGSSVQQVDRALPPDHKSKPARGLIVVGGTLAALLLASLWVVARRYRSFVQAANPDHDQAWHALQRAWRWRG